MTIISRLVGAFGKLPAAETHALLIERDLPVPMPDGTILLANRFAPRGVEKPPLILVRSCYGRTGLIGLLYGRIFAERGFQVLIQSTRGTFGSGGTFEPLIHERDDGLATVAWLKQQPWFPGAFGTMGLSYLGYVQWAIAREAGPELKAMAIQVSSAEFRNPIYAGEAFSLELTLAWTHLVAYQERTNLLKQLLFPASRTLRAVYSHLPLREVDLLATGRKAPFFQEWLEHDQPESAYWRQRSFEANVKEVASPVNLVAGWYDIFLPWQLRDYRALRDAGKCPFLTVGPWAHTTSELNFFSIRESLAWLHAHLREDRSQLRAAPVRVFVTGANEWRELNDWPPPDAIQQRWYLQPGKGLAPELPPISEPDRYRYDPANPTPVLAGPLLGGKSLPTDNRRLEERADVLTYTSAALDQELDVIGPVQTHLSVRSSLEHTDFFVRLCDVDTQGRSINVCDALLRVSPGRPAPLLDGTLYINFGLWPTAHRFCAGHRIRVQISSGAHPRFARNTGSGEPLATAVKLLRADQTIYHDPERPSGIVLSVLPTGQTSLDTNFTV